MNELILKYILKGFICSFRYKERSKLIILHMQKENIQAEHAMSERVFSDPAHISYVAYAFEKCESMIKEVSNAMQES